jgi:hypothetical protein
MLKKTSADHASDILLYTSISKYILVYDVSYNLTPPLYFESGLVRLATPTGICSTLLPSRYLPLSGLPYCSLLDCQPSQAGPSAPKLPQPRVDLIDIAAQPSVHPNGKPETLCWLNRWGIVGVELADRKKRDKAGPAHHVFPTMFSNRLHRNALSAGNW